jgi:hypothetical protein
MRGAPIAIVSGLAVLVLQGCSLVLQGAPTERAFRRGPASQPYVADAARAESIISGVQQVKICTRRTEVRQLMGEPDFGELTYDSNGNHSAAEWTYLISEQPGAKRAVKVTLNKAGHVISIVPLGLPEVSFSVVMDGPGCQST